MTNLLLRDLSTGQQYGIQIRAKNNEGYSEWSPIATFTTVSDSVAPATPANFTFTAEGTAFAASWDAVTTNADGSAINDFKEYILTFEAGSAVVEKHTTATSYTFDFETNRAIFGVAQGSITAFVQAVDQTGNRSTPSNSILVENPIPTTPSAIDVQALNDAISVDWEPVADDDLARYILSVSVNGVNGAYTQIYSGPDTAFLYPTTLYDSDHFFKVHAVDVFGNPGGNAVSLGVRPTRPFSIDSTPPGVPTGLAAIITNNPAGTAATATVSWNNAGDANGYQIRYRPVGDTTWFQVSADEDASDIAIDISPYKDYEFEIDAYDWQGNMSAWSASVTASPPANPVPSDVANVVMSASVDSILVSWDAVADEDLKYYEVAFGTMATPSTGGVIYNTGATALTISGLNSETTYYAQVRAIDNAGQPSNWSAAVNTTTGVFPTGGDPNSDGVPPASSPTPTVTGGIGYLLVSWDAVSNADLVTYEIHTSTASGFTPSTSTKVAEIAGTVAAIDRNPNGSQMAYGTTYYVKTIAKDMDGSAAPSAQGSGSPVRAGSNDIDITPSDIGAASQDDLDVTNQNVTNAQTAANGKNQVIYSTTDATGTQNADGVDYVDGDIWFKVSGQDIVAFWLYNAGWQPQQLTDETIANLDAGKITTGYLDADRIQAGSLVIGQVSDLQNTLDDKTSQEYIASRGTDLVANGTGYLKNNYNFSASTFDPTDAPVGTSGSFTAGPGYKTITSDELIPVDVNKKYDMRLAVRQQVEGLTTSVAYAGLQPYDNAGNGMSVYQYQYDPDTMTTLASPVTAGDTTITVTSLPGDWEKVPTYKYIGFWNWQDSFGKVWEQGTYTRNVVTYSSVSGTTITLSAPYSGPDLPAGNPLSRNWPGGNYMYMLSPSALIDNEWRTYSVIDYYGVPYGGIHDGRSSSTSAATHAFPQGCANVRIIILSNHSVGDQTGVQAWAAISFSDASAAQNAADEANTSIGNWTYTGTTNIDGGKIQTDSVTAIQIAAHTISSDEMVIGTITAASGIIADAAITNAKIADATITDAKISNLSVTKLTSGTISSTNISLGLNGVMTVDGATGAIKSNNYVAGSTGWQLGYQGLEVNTGSISASALIAGTISGANMITLSGAGAKIVGTGFSLSGTGLSITSGSISAAALNLQVGNNIAPFSIATMELTIDEMPLSYSTSASMVASMSADEHDLNQSLQIQQTGATGRTVYLNDTRTNNVNISNAQSVIVSAWIKSTATNAVTLQVFNGTTSLGTVSSGTLTANTWKRISLAVSATTAGINIGLVLPAVAATFNIDSVQVEYKTGNVNTPSPWSPPSATKIFGGMIAAGAITAESGIIQSIDASTITTGTLNVSNLTISGTLTFSNVAGLQDALDTNAAAAQSAQATANAAQLDIDSLQDEITSNSSFNTWPDGQLAPTGWQTLGTTARVSGRVAGGYAAQFDVAAGGTDGLYYSTDESVENFEFVTIIADFRLDAGTLDNTNAIVRWKTSDQGNFDVTIPLDQLINVVSPTIDTWYRVELAVKRPDMFAGTFAGYEFHLEVDATPTAETVSFDSLHVGPSSTSEVNAYNAADESEFNNLQNQIDDTGASISSNYELISSAIGANTATQTQLDNYTTSTDSMLSTFQSGFDVLTGIGNAGVDEDYIIVGDDPTIGTIKTVQISTYVQANLYSSSSQEFASNFGLWNKEDIGDIDYTGTMEPPMTTFYDTFTSHGLQARPWN